MLTESEFLGYRHAGYTLVPLWQTLPLPHAVDAVDLYRVLANQGQDYLFETGEHRDGAFQLLYSVIGLPCRERIELDEGELRRYCDDALMSTTLTNDPLAELALAQQSRRVPRFDALPRFAGGMFGYFGFETTRLIEPRLRRQARKPSGLNPELPDAVQWLSVDLVVVDHRQQCVHCIVHEAPRSPEDYRRARQRLTHLVDSVGAQLRMSGVTPLTALAAAAEPDTLSFRFPRRRFEQAVHRIKDYIAAGDVMQVVLSQRMSRPFEADALTLYRALSSVAQTPYRYLLNLGASQIVGASPEMLFRRHGAHVTSRPMAGTRRRGATAEQDARLKRELLADPKEIAEHMMLVDLARNDLGRCAELGSVQVDELLTVEKFSHVMHIVSTVSGHMAPHTSALDVLKSTFPAGTLSGASKVRALEVIAELEPHARGVYGGSIGYLGWHGDADQAIAIRTAVLQGGQLHMQAGAGVVQDSVAEREWQETMEKSRMMLLAADMATRLAANRPVEGALCI